MVTIYDVKLGLYTHGLDTDWIAVDADGTPVARTVTREAVERAAPEAAGYFTGPDFQPIADEDNLRTYANYLRAPSDCTHSVYMHINDDGIVLATGYCDTSRREGEVPRPEGATATAYSKRKNLPAIGEHRSDSRFAAVEGGGL